MRPKPKGCSAARSEVEDAFATAADCSAVIDRVMISLIQLTAGVDEAHHMYEVLFVRWEEPEGPIRRGRPVRLDSQGRIFYNLPFAVRVESYPVDSTIVIIANTPVPMAKVTARFRHPMPAFAVLLRRLFQCRAYPAPRHVDGDESDDACIVCGVAAAAEVGGAFRATNQPDVLSFACGWCAKAWHRPCADFLSRRFQHLGEGAEAGAFTAPLASAMTALTKMVESFCSPPWGRDVTMPAGRVLGRRGITCPPCAISKACRGMSRPCSNPIHGYRCGLGFQCCLGVRTPGGGRATEGDPADKQSNGALLNSLASNATCVWVLSLSPPPPQYGEPRHLRFEAASGAGASRCRPDFAHRCGPIGCSATDGRCAHLGGACGRRAGRGAVVRDTGVSWPPSGQPILSLPIRWEGARGWGTIGGTLARRASIASALAARIGVVGAAFGPAMPTRGPRKHRLGFASCQRREFGWRLGLRQDGCMSLHLAMIWSIMRYPYSQNMAMIFPCFEMVFPTFGNVCFINIQFPSIGNVGRPNL